MPSPREKDFVLVNSAPSPLNPCLHLTVHLSVHAFHTRDVFARLSAHSRYRAPNRKQALNRKSEAGSVPDQICVLWSLRSET